MRDCSQPLTAWHSVCGQVQTRVHVTSVSHCPFIGARESCCYSSCMALKRSPQVAAPLVGHRNVVYSTPSSHAPSTFKTTFRTRMPLLQRKTADFTSAAHTQKQCRPCNEAAFRIEFRYDHTSSDPVDDAMNQPGAFGGS